MHKLHMLVYSILLEVSKKDFGFIKCLMLNYLVDRQKEMSWEDSPVKSSKHVYHDSRATSPKTDVFEEVVSQTVYLYFSSKKKKNKSLTCILSFS